MRNSAYKALSKSISSSTWIWRTQNMASCF